MADEKTPHTPATFGLEALPEMNYDSHHGSDTDAQLDTESLQQSTLKVSELLQAPPAEFSQQIGQESKQVLRLLFGKLKDDFQTTTQAETKLEIYVRMQMLSRYVDEEFKAELKGFTIEEFQGVMIPENEQILRRLLTAEESRTYISRLFKEFYEQLVTWSKQMLATAGIDAVIQVVDQFFTVTSGLHSLLKNSEIRKYVQSPSDFILSQDLSNFAVIKKTCLSDIEITFNSSFASSMSEISVEISQMADTFSQRATILSNTDVQILQKVAVLSPAIQEKLLNFQIVQKIATYLNRLNRSLKIGDPDSLQTASQTFDLPPKIMDDMKLLLTPLHNWLSKYAAVKGRCQRFSTHAQGSKSDLMEEITELHQAFGVENKFSFEEELHRVDQVRQAIDELFDAATTDSSMLQIWKNRAKHKSQYDSDPYFLKRYLSFLEDLAAKASRHELNLQEILLRNEIARMIGSKEFAYDSNTIQSEVKRYLEQPDDFDEFTAVLDTQLTQAAEYMHRGINTYDVIASVLEKRLEVQPYDVQLTNDVRKSYLKILVNNQHPKISAILLAWFNQGESIEMELYRNIGELNLRRVLEGNHHQLAGYFRSESLISCVQSMRYFKQLHAAGYEASKQALLVARQIVGQKLQRSWDEYLEAGQYSAAVVQMQQLEPFSEEIEECNPSIMVELQKYLDIVGEFDASVSDVLSITELSSDSMKGLQDRLQKLDKLADARIAEVSLSKFPPFDSLLPARKTYDLLVRIPFELQFVVNLYQATASLDLVNTALRECIFLWLNDQQIENVFKTLGVNIKVRELVAKLVVHHPFLKIKNNELQVISAAELVTSELGQKVEGVRAEIAKLEKEREELHEQLTILPDEIRRMQLERTQQQNQVAEISREISLSTQAVAELKEELLSVQKLEAQARDKLVEMQAIAEKTERKLTGIRSQAAQHLQEIELLTTREQHLEEQKSELEAKVLKSENSINELNTQLKNLEEELTSLRSVMVRIQALLENSQTEITSKNVELQSVMTELLAQQTEFQKKTTELNALQAKVDAVYRKVESQTLVLNHLQQRDSSVQQQNTEAQQTIDKLQAELQLLTSEIAQLQNARQRLEDLKSENQRVLSATIDGLPANVQYVEERNEKNIPLPASTENSH